MEKSDTAVEIMNCRGRVSPGTAGNHKTFLSVLQKKREVGKNTGWDR